MQALVERALSGRSACCSTSHAAPHACSSQSRRSAVPQRRAAAVVVTASVPSRSGTGRTQGQKGGSKKTGPDAKRKQDAKGKQAAKGKQPAKASPPPPKPQRPGSAGPAAVRPTRSPAPAGASPHLPRPATRAGPSMPTLPVGAQLVPAGVGAATSAAAAAGAAAAGGHEAAPSGPTPQGASPARGAPSSQASTPILAAARDPDQDTFVADDDDGDGDGDGFLDADGDAGEAEGLADNAGADDGGEDEEGEVFPEIEFNLPNPSNVKVKTAEYLKSSVSVTDCPAPRFAEFAVIGRSNVGKSSIINMLTGRKDLALVSKQPGKTKCINHFLINGSWYFVDLPGYGFAKVGLQGRQQFDAFTREYFKTRPNLAMVFLLVDASIPPQKIDIEYANWLTDNEVPYTLVFTKADKRRKGVSSADKDSHVTAFKRALLRDLAFLPPSILTSAAKGLGRGEMLNFIAGLRIAFEKSGRLTAIRQGML